MTKYKIVKANKDKEIIIESNIEECELESYLRKYLQFSDFRDWYENHYGVVPEDAELTIEQLEDHISNYIEELRENIVDWSVDAYLGNGFRVKSYEQNVRLFISLFDYGELSPVCAKPDGEHKLIILDNGVVHSDTTEKPVGTINYNVGVDDFSFNSFKFCGEVVISTNEYLDNLANDKKSLADMILEHFNGRTPFDIEFAEREKQ